MEEIIVTLTSPLLTTTIVKGNITLNGTLVTTATVTPTGLTTKII
tara:strand:+ start:712 stop:846 length:135 start_codon:yes stop_codon:yes gene_type:complete